jgi:3-oxoadipate enol-lactonase
VMINHEVRGNGPPLIFLAGLGLDLTVWNPLAALLEDRFTCLLVDNRGSGKSDTPGGPYTIEEMAADTIGLARSLHVDRFTVVGHSMGGLIALQLAANFPKAVSGLILLSTARGGRSDALGSTPDAIAALGRTRGPVEDIIRETLTVCVGEAFYADHAGVFEALVSERIERRATGRGIAGQRAACGRFDFSSRLDEISCPCTVVHGSEDRVASPEKGEQLARGIRGARLVVLDRVGHMPQWEATEQLAEIIGASF